jgi:serine/threonine protein kinase
MAQFTHTKIVKLFGVVTVSEPTMIVLEFMEMGSLLSYLQNSIVKNKLKTSEMTRFACQISAGMHYLGELNFVHRDLAARNVLINKHFVCKVADFGLSQVSSEMPKNTKGDKIPVRWTAPEALMQRQFSTSSDVWSFGIVLWEIWTYGDIPYGTWGNERIIQEVTEGYRLSRPRTCPNLVYALMLEAWAESATERPSFYIMFQRMLVYHKSCLRSESGKDPYDVHAQNDKLVEDEAGGEAYLTMDDENSAEPQYLDVSQQGLYDESGGTSMGKTYDETYLQFDEQKPATKHSPGLLSKQADDDQYLDMDQQVPQRAQPTIVTNNAYQTVDEATTAEHKSTSKRSSVGDSSGYLEIPSF